MRFSWDVSSRQGWGSHVEVHRTHVKECTCLQTAIYYKSVQIKTLEEEVEPQVTGIVHAMYSFAKKKYQRVQEEARYAVLMSSY